MQPTVGGRDTVAWLLFIVLGICSLSPSMVWIVMWFFPLPLTILSATRSLHISGALSVILGLCLTHAGLGWSSWMVALSVFFMAWVMGDALKNKSRLFAPVITGTLVVVMVELVLLSLLRWQGHDLGQEILRSLEAASRANGPHQSSQWQAFTRDFKTNFSVLLPGMLCVIGFLLATLNLLGARLILYLGLNRDESVLKPFLDDFQLPSGVSVLYLVMTACFMLGMFKQPGWPAQFARNVALLSGFFMGIQGLASMWRRMRRTPGRFGILLLLITAGCLIRLIGQLYILVGLYDTLSYRRRRDV